MIMKSILSHLAAATAIASSCSAFSIHPSSLITKSPSRDVSCHMKQDGHDNNNEAPQPSSHLTTRRSAISIIPMLPLGIITLFSSNPLLANAASSAKGGTIVVMGGAGWVGAHVCQRLQTQGYTVVSISRSTSEIQTERTKSILGTTIPGVKYVSLDAGAASSTEDLAKAMKGALAVISCVGIAPGGSNVKDGNGVVNARIAKAAKSAGVPKFVYIGVASSLANSPAKFVLGDYFKGKAEAEKNVAQEFGAEKSLIIKPAIIAGGTPGELRPPGPPGVKPVTVDAVAKVVVAGALGDLSGTIDGNDDIVGRGAP